MDRALTFDEPYYLGYRILRRNRYHHVHVIGHEMSFFDSALLLLRQAAKYFAKMPACLLVEDSSSALWYENYVIYAVPFCMA